jgi:hypothetical protein
LSIGRLKEERCLKYLNLIVVRSVRLLTLLALAFLPLVPAVNVYAIDSVHLTGVITGPGGGPEVGAEVVATDPGTTLIAAAPVNTESDGSYDLVATPGTYDIHILSHGATGGNNPPDLVENNFFLNQDSTLSEQFDSGPILGTVTNLSAVSTAAGVELTWDWLDGANAYTISRDSTGIGLSTTNTFIDTTASIGNHTYVIAATNTNTNSTSINSNEVTINNNHAPDTPIDPAAPIGLVALTPGADATLSWNAGAEDYLYGIFRDGGIVGFAWDNNFTNQYVDSIAAPGTHSYCILALSRNNGIASPSSECIDVSVGSATNLRAFPDKPLNLTGYSPILTPTVSWDAVPGASSYHVFRDGVEVGTTTFNSFTEQGVAQGTYDYTAMPYDGNNLAGTLSDPITIQVGDTTPPQITSAVSPSPNGAGWNNSDTTVAFTCSSTTAIIVSCTPPVNLSSDGANQQVSGTATDSFGNTANKVVTINLDKTAPVISLTLSSPANANGWHKAPVTVTYHCNDTLSGVASCPGPVTISTNTSGQTVSGTATDVAGNSASTSVTIKLDQIPPTVSGLTSSSLLILNSGSTNLSANASDALSGVTGGEYYVDTDPGQGNGGVMAYNSSTGKISGTLTVGVNGLSRGVHTIYVRSKDAAGNWSTTVSTTLIYV